MLRIKLTKSPIANTPKNRATVRALGLRKVNQVVQMPDNAAIRGMIHRIKHLLTVEVVEGEPTPRKGPTRASRATARKSAAPKLLVSAPTATEKEAAPKPKRQTAKQPKTASKPAPKPAAKSATPKGAASGGTQKPKTPAAKKAAPFRGVGSPSTTSTVKRCLIR